VLFINKVDRLINELKIEPEDMLKRFVKVITEVNKLIVANMPEDLKKKGFDWTVDVNNGSVSFGSAYYNWAINVKKMKEKGLNFKDIYQYMKEGKQDELAKKIPLHETVLEMVIHHLPNPRKAQPYRIPKIWRGDLSSDEGKAMLSSSKDGPFVMMVTDVSTDPHAGDIATGRVYSGTIKKGDRVKLIGSGKEATVQQVAIYMGPERVIVSKISAGNIGSIIGVKDVYAGETISTKEIEMFESFLSNAEPVMTVSVEPKNPQDLAKLINVLKQISKEDPNIKVYINQDTGELLMSGMGELHLEVKEHMIKNDYGIDVNIGTPVIVYFESVEGKSPEVEGKSPNSTTNSS